MRTNRQRWLSGLAAVFLLVGGIWLYRWWTRPPAVEFDNLRYIQLLRTAVSSRRDDYVQGVERAVRTRRDEGAMSDSEAAHFDEILSLARSGEWQSAEQMAFDFEGAQANRRRSRPRNELHD